MPVDSILVSAAVVSVFGIFASVLIWAKFPDRTGAARAGRRQPKAPQLLIMLCRVTGPRAAFEPTNLIGTIPSV